MLVMLLVFMIAFVGVNGAIGVARVATKTTRGLDLNQVTSRTPTELFIASFESLVFSSPHQP